MKPAGILAVVVCAVGAMIAVVWLGRYTENGPSLLRAPVENPADRWPKVASSGPHPKAVIDLTEHDFDTMAFGQKGKHLFTIRNEGEADLVVTANKEDTTCQCTFGELSETGKIAPGKSVDVTINWEIKARVESFRHQAIVRTNDPEKKEIALVVKGKVDQLVDFRPPAPWNCGDLSATEATVFKAKVISPIMDAFSIAKTTIPSQHVKFEAIPLTTEELQEAGVKSGYAVTITVSPEAPVGVLNEAMVMSVEGQEPLEFTIPIMGRKVGPVGLMGVAFREELGAVLMGEFAAATGKEVTLTLYSHEFDDELKVAKVDPSTSRAQVELSRDTKFTGKRPRYFLKVRVPPGEPASRIGDEGELLEIHLNHPKVPVFKLQVRYLAL